MGQVAMASINYFHILGTYLLLFEHVLREKYVRMFVPTLYIMVQVCHHVLFSSWLPYFNNSFVIKLSSKYWNKILGKYEFDMLKIIIIIVWHCLNNFTIVDHGKLHNFKIKIFFWEKKIILSMWKLTLGYNVNLLTFNDCPMSFYRSPNPW
jgi:hypothetical protein